ncbi:MAG: hypothetical protein WCX65_17165 [bacterium]
MSKNTNRLWLAFTVLIICFSMPVKAALPPALGSESVFDFENSVAVPQYAGAAATQTPALEKPSSAAPAGAPGEVSAERVIDKNDSFSKKILSKDFKIELKGYRYFLYRTYNSTGNEQNFLSFNGLMMRGAKIEQGSDMDITLKYGDDIELTGKLYEIPYQERDLKFEMNAGNFRTLFGEFPAEFRSGTLASLNKKISGAEIQYTTKKIQADWLSSQSKSSPKTVTFTGDNSHGPFSLDAFQILPNSELVKINGELIQSDKYTMDYYVGQITFCEEGNSTQCIEIKSSDTVQVTFEQKLLLSLNGGNINGISAQYNFTENTSIGAAHISEQANRATQRIRSTGVYSVKGDALLAQPDSNIIQIPSTGALYPAFRFLITDRNFISVKLNGSPLTFDQDYTIKYRDYLLGRITLLATTINPNDIYEVSYSYYAQSADFIGEVHDEKLTGKGERTFNLTGSQTGIIYPGSETVYYCQTDICLPPDAVLKSAEEDSPGDYIIFKGSNQINLTNFIPNEDQNTYVKMVSYLTVPDASPTSSDYDHTVSQIFGTAKAGPADIKFEFGNSNADISKTPIQIVNEKVAVLAAALTCPNANPAPPECVFKLRNTDLAESSEKVTISSSDYPLTRGLNYTVEYDTGTLILTGDQRLEAGTVIYTDYRFNPPITEGIKSGNASRIGITANLGGYNATIQSDKTDTFFSPIGGNNTLETSRTALGLSGSPTKSFTFALNKTDYDTARDILKIVSTKNSAFGGDLRFTRGKNALQYSFKKDTARDNQPIPQADQVRKNSSVSLSFADLFRPNLNVDFSISNENFNDLTHTVNDTSSRGNKLGVKYKHGDKLELETVFTDNKISSSGATLPFTSRSGSRNILLSYYPAKLVTVSANIDHQRKNDSRVTQGVTGKDATAISVTALEMGKLQSISFSVTKQSFPGFASASYNNSFSILNLSYALTAALMFSPSISDSSSSTSNSTSDAKRKTAKFEYRPKNKPYALVTTREWATYETRQVSKSPDSSDSNVFSLDINYKFGQRLDFLYRYNKTDDKSKDSNRSNLLQSFNFGYDLNERQKYSLVYSVVSRRDLTSTSTGNLALESDISLSKAFHWKTTFNNSKYSDDKYPIQNYKGQFLETEFRAEF